MKNGYRAMMALAGLGAAMAAEAQSSFTSPFTLTAGSGPTYLMLTWDPINGYSTRTSGQTTVVYFIAPQPADMFDDPAEPAYVISYGYGGYTGNLNGITPGEVTAGAVLNSSSDFSDPSSSTASFNPADNETGSYFGIDYNAGGGNFNYGWVEYSTTSDSFTLEEAYMNTTVNQAVTVGQGINPVPEPSTFALGALSILGLLLTHRARALNERKAVSEYLQRQGRRAPRKLS
jgi:hypothetical protein